jgi:hypothetical protein
MRDVVDQMLSLLDRRLWSVTGSAGTVHVTIAGTTIDLDTTAPGVELAFERLAAAIEAIIAPERVRLMLEATEMTSEPIPLWLLSGSNVLSQWLRWSGTGSALRKVLALTGELGLAPIAGYLDRRARRDLGQGGAKIRVRGGIAVAERIELSERPHCIAVIGERTQIRLENFNLPDTLLDGFQPTADRNRPRLLGEIVDHPFIAANDLEITGVSQQGSTAVFEIRHRWAPLELVPDAALAALPADFDATFPWRATAGERRRLDGLVEEARHRAAAKSDPR